MKIENKTSSVTKDISSMDGLDLSEDFKKDAISKMDAVTDNDKHTKIHFSDHIEMQVAAALDFAGIEYVHESEDKEQRLDFYLPTYGIYIEIKQFYTDRADKQMQLRDNVIVVQGRASVNFLISILQQTGV